MFFHFIEVLWCVMNIILVLFYFFLSEYRLIFTKELLHQSSTFKAITSFTIFNDRSHSNCFYSLSNSTFAVFLTVRPDPPVSLNWTLLNISPSGLSYDVMVNWEPPPSADVRAGWMRIEYEIQYRERNTTSWEAVSLLFFFT